MKWSVSLTPSVVTERSMRQGTKRFFFLPGRSSVADDTSKADTSLTTTQVCQKDSEVIAVVAVATFKTPHNSTAGPPTHNTIANRHHNHLLRSDQYQMNGAEDNDERMRHKVFNRDS
ncbi:unnamed protein product [Nippostrongylus brasiliensis]|uniref:Uncharacterized protein n=1 Tax=Nippostrongylus brasiliensis TaxID=27835 RepID=A0A0N4XTZ1_NIPBR|nr:unnamed protein product [Nippostrongylus brasiliensis]